jgi:hypothetical protein
LGERLKPECNRLELHLKEQYVQDGGKSRPDFVVWSRNKTAAVVMDAKAYHGTLGPDQVVKLRRDMDIFEEEGGVIVHFGIIYHYSSDTNITSSAKEAAKRWRIIFLDQEECCPRNVARAIYTKFYH